MKGCIYTISQPNSSLGQPIRASRQLMFGRLQHLSAMKDRMFSLPAVKTRKHESLEARQHIQILDRKTWSLDPRNEDAGI